MQGVAAARVGEPEQGSSSSAQQQVPPGQPRLSGPAGRTRSHGGARARARRQPRPHARRVHRGGELLGHLRGHTKGRGERETARAGRHGGASWACAPRRRAPWPPVDVNEGRGTDGGVTLRRCTTCGARAPSTKAGAGGGEELAAGARQRRAAPPLAAALPTQQPTNLLEQHTVVALGGDACGAGGRSSRAGRRQSEWWRVRGGRAGARATIYLPLTKPAGPRLPARACAPARPPAPAAQTRGARAPACAKPSTAPNLLTDR